MIIITDTHCMLPEGRHSSKNFIILTYFLSTINYNYSVIEHRHREVK